MNIRGPVFPVLFNSDSNSEQKSQEGKIQGIVNTFFQITRSLTPPEIQGDADICVTDFW